MISSQSSLNMTKEQEHYVVGLSDALQVIEDLQEKQISVGKDYYVIVKNTEQIPKYIIKKKCDCIVLTSKENMLTVFQETHNILHQTSFYIAQSD